MLSLILFFFFFQAEDGIRDLTVTGVQTCALPILFVAGDLSDPHGTDRMCQAAVAGALAQYDAEPPEVWLYRGAWQEWPITEADVLVPLSQDELRAKILAIFKHQSQKDTAPFPGGHDEREFWQRVEARNLERSEEHTSELQSQSNLLCRLLLENKKMHK